MVSRAQIAQVLVASLTSQGADHKTLELVAERGAERSDLKPLFAALVSDAKSGIDGVHDTANMPLAEEPQRVLDDLERVQL